MKKRNTFYWIVFCFLFSKKTLAAEEGMPQLNPEYWISQIFWLTFIFGSLYLLLSKLILPKISYNLESRKSQIAENIESADKQRKEEAASRGSSSSGLLASIGMALAGKLLFGGGLGGGGGLFGGRKSTGLQSNLTAADLGGVSASTLPPALRPMGGMIPYMAGGGGVGYSAGVDTVPAMLSGGEFVMNAAATSRIGASNLEALNSGGSIGGGSSMSVTKGDTNISIVVNSDGSEGQESQTGAGEQDKTLAVKLKDAVKDVISQEKRLGGMLAT